MNRRMIEKEILSKGGEFTLVPENPGWNNGNYTKGVDITPMRGTQNLFWVEYWAMSDFSYCPKYGYFQSCHNCSEFDCDQENGIVRTRKEVRKIIKYHLNNNYNYIKNKE